MKASMRRQAFWATLGGLLVLPLAAGFSTTHPSTTARTTPPTARALALRMAKEAATPTTTETGTPTSPYKEPRKVLIVGGGLGGISAAFDAKHNLRPQDHVTVVSDSEFFHFHPSNPWVATRKRKPEDIRLPLTEVLPSHGIEFVHAKAAHLDPQAQTLHVESHEDPRSSLSYDYLIIATGPRLAFDEVPGADLTKATTISVCTTPHASHAAEQIDKLVESPGPIVVGAAAGASCFGPAYEFSLLLQNELRKRGGEALLEACPMTFVTPEPYIGHLGLMGTGESNQILEGLLTKNNIDYYTNCQVDRVTSSHVELTQMEDADTTHKLKLPSRFTMLIPPFRGQHLWKEVPHLTDEKGMILVNEFQQSPAYPNIFAVGICVSIPAIEETLVPTGPPKTGYLIESQGTAAVKNIRALIEATKKHVHQDGSPQDALRHRPLLNGLCITDFGPSGAIFLALPQYPPRRKDITISGKVAVMAKIAFEKYFLHKIATGDTDPYYEKYMLHLIGVDRVTSSPTAAAAAPKSE